MSVGRRGRGNVRCRDALREASEFGGRRGEGAEDSEIDGGS